MLLADAPDLGQIVFVVIFLVVGFLQWLYKLIQEKKEAAAREQRAPRTQAEVEEIRRARLEELQQKRRELQEQRRADGSPSPAAPPRLPNSPPTAPTFGGPMAELFETLRRAAESATPPQKQHMPAPAPQQTQPSPYARHEAPPVSASPYDQREHGKEHHTRRASEYRPTLPLPPPLPGPSSLPKPQTAAESRRSHSVSVDEPLQIAPMAAERSMAASPGVMSLEEHLERQANVTSRANAAYNTKAAPSGQGHSLTHFLRTTHGYQQAFVLREVLGPPKALQSSDEWLY